MWHMEFFTQDGKTYQSHRKVLLPQYAKQHLVFFMKLDYILVYREENPFITQFDIVILS